jgi:hypothetical protein
MTMPLDDFTDLSTPQPKGLAVLQKIALGLEIVLLVFAAIGLFFKVMSFPYADELLVLSYMSLPMIYLCLPILLFKSKKGAEHLLAHLVGIFLFVAIISVLFKLMSWPMGSEMALLALYFSIPIGLTLILLTVVNFKDQGKRYFYLRMGLRFVLVLVQILVY